MNRILAPTVRKFDDDPALWLIVVCVVWVILIILFSQMTLPNREL